MLATSWLSMDKTSCKTAARSIPPRRPRQRKMRRTPTEGNRLRRSKATRRAARARGGARKLRNRVTPLGSRNESITAVYFAAGRHHIADGGDFAGGFCGVPSVAGLCFAASRLSDDPGANILSRRQPGRDGVFGDGAARAAVWPGAGTETNELNELLLQLRYHAAIRSRSQHRRGRAGGASVHQRRFQSFAARAAPPADLQQDYS